MKKSRNKRILLISALHVWSMGNKKGAGSFYKTIKGFSQRFSVDLICHGPQSALPRSVRCHIINLSILDRLVRTPVANYVFYPMWWLLFVIRSRQIANNLILENRPDIIYAYEIQAVPAAHALSKRFKIPLVTRFQGTKLELHRVKQFTQYYPISPVDHDLSCSPSKLKLGLQYVSYLINNYWYRIKYFDHFIALKTPADLVIMTNDGTQGDKVLRRLENKSKTVFWLNGIEKRKDYSPAMIRLTRDRLGLGSNDKMILMVSRLVGWKRVDRMISILPKLDADYKLIIAGDGPEKSQLEEIVKQYGKDDVVEFLGAVKKDKIDELMAAADIFVSLYDLSNVGNPLLQAMSNGKAIVTLDIGDTKRFIDKTRGILLPPDKPDKLADSINTLIGDAGIRHRLGTKAKQFAQNNFWSWSERIKAEIKEVEKLTRN